MCQRGVDLWTCWRLLPDTVVLYYTERCVYLYNPIDVNKCRQNPPFCILWTHRWLKEDLREALYVKRGQPFLKRGSGLQLHLQVLSILMLLQMQFTVHIDSYLNSIDSSFFSRNLCRFNYTRQNMSELMWFYKHVYLVWKQLKWSGENRILVLNKKLNTHLFAISPLSPSFSLTHCLSLSPPHIALYTNWSTVWHVVQRMSQTAHQLWA